MNTNNIEGIINEIFDVLLKVVRSNRHMCEKLNDGYKRWLIDYLNLLPEDKHVLAVKYFNIAKTILTCIDFDKLINLANSSNIPSLKIDSKTLICNFIANNISNKIGGEDKKTKKFVEKLLQNLDNIFEVIDYILKNPKEIASNANVFVTINDDLF